MDNRGDADHDLDIADIPVVNVTEPGRHAHHHNAHEHDHGASALHVHAEPGAYSWVRFTPTEPGEYRFICTVPGHEDLDMEGTLVVRPAGGGATHDHGEVHEGHSHHDDHEHHHGPGLEPVGFLEDTLRAVIIAPDGETTRELPLRPMDGQPGNYISDILLTEPGHYRVKIQGFIHDVEVNEAFDLHEVIPLSDLRVP